MNHKKLWFPMIIFLFSIVSCQEEIEEKEVYKKIVYIVNGENMLNYFTHPFTGEVTEGFISLYCSGSRMPEKDIDIEIGFDDELIDKFNYIEFEDDTTKYVKALGDDHFNIPSFRVTIKRGEPFGIMPIYVNPEGLSPDSTYVIPLKIVKISDYEKSEELSSILYAIRLENAYSGLYRMTVSLLEEGISEQPLQVFKENTLVPIDLFSCRMFIATESELEENIETKTVEFTIGADHLIEIREENDVLDLGNSFYDPEKEMFCLNYSFPNGGKRYEIKEKLVRIETDE